MSASDGTPAGDALGKLRIDRDAAAQRRRTPWGRIVLGAAVLLLLVGVVAAKGEAWTAPTVELGRVKRISATEGAVETTANGYVVARRKAAISSKLSGRLDELLVDVGTVVKKGEVLGRLGHDDLDASVARAKADADARRKQAAAAKADAAAMRRSADAATAQLASADAAIGVAKTELTEAVRTLAMQEKLHAAGAGSRDTVETTRAAKETATLRLEQARKQHAAALAEVARATAAADAADAQAAAWQAQVAAAEAGIAEAEALRRDADIVAPFDGRVVRKEAEVGEMVAPVNAAGSTTRGAVVSVVDFSSLEMEVDVVERDIARVREGGACRIVLDSRREAPYRGVVRQKVPTADRTKATVQVKVAFEKLDDAVYPEMGGRVEFLVPGRESAALATDRVTAPADAFTESGGKKGFFVVRNARVAFVEAAAGDPVGTGADALRDVTSGLAGGEDVVRRPPAGLADGDLVSPSEPAAAPAK